MKRLLAILVAFTMASFAMANDALEKGSRDFGGGFSYSSYSGDLYENTKDEAATRFTLTPSLGIFVINNLSVGFTVGFESRTQGDFTQSELSFGPRVHYYLPKIGSGNPFLKLGIEKASYKWNWGNSQNEESLSSISYGAGYIFFVNEKIGATVSLTYSKNSGKIEKPTEGKDIDGVNLMFSFGFRMFL